MLRAARPAGLDLAGGAARAGDTRHHAADGGGRPDALPRRSSQRDLVDEVGASRRRARSARTVSTRSDALPLSALTASPRFSGVLASSSAPTPDTFTSGRIDVYWHRHRYRRDRERRSRRRRALHRLRIACRYDQTTIAIGASIACNGVCLTVVASGVEGGNAPGSRSTPPPRRSA